ncbi:MAG: DUF2089 domain-containing protein [Acholeplasmataceae bacterium]|nr:DUF2089 domain-containing protein [Acholeplasmataceae bacterium]
MNEDRKKILGMLAEGTITPEEAEELLDQLEKNDDDKIVVNYNFREDLQKTKEELLKAKQCVENEMCKIDLNSVKEKMKEGIKKVDEAMMKVDQKLSVIGNAIKEKIMKKEEQNGRADENSGDVSERND